MDIERPRRYARDDKNSFFYWLVDANGMSDSTGKAYISALRKVERFAKEKEYIRGSLYEISEADINNLLERVLSDADFPAVSNATLHLIQAAINKLIVYLSENKSILQSKNSGNEIKIIDYSLFGKQEYTEWLSIKKGYSKKQIDFELSVMEGIEKYASQTISGECSIFNTNLEKIGITLNELLSNEAFIDKISEQFASIYLFLDFISEIKRNGNTLLKELKETTERNIVQVIKEKYPFGFNINSPIEILRFRAFYEDKFGQPIEEDDKDLLSYIENNCVNNKGKAYYIKPSVIEQLNEILNSIASEGYSILYYTVFYDQYEDWLYSEHIIDAEMLKLVLQHFANRYLYRENYLLIKADQKYTEQQALVKELENHWGNSMLCTVEELHRALPYIPVDKIKYALSSSNSFVWNSQETYALAEKFIITNSQIQELSECASEKCTENGSITFDELPLDEILSDNYELSEVALYDLIFSYLSSQFSRNKKVITLKNTGQNAYEAISAYCKSHEKCSFDDLISIMERVEGVIRLPVIVEAACSEMVRVSEELFVQDKLVSFDVNTVDSLLDDIVRGDGVGIRAITAFGAFPDCGYPWNLFLVESYCRRFSKLFKYECITPNSKNAGAIIRNDSKLSFHQIMAHSLAQSNVKLNEKEVYDFLIEAGFLLRRRYYDIEDLIETAKKLRKGE